MQTVRSKFWLRGQAGKTVQPVEHPWRKPIFRVHRNYQVNPDQILARGGTQKAKRIHDNDKAEHGLVKVSGIHS